MLKVLCFNSRNAGKIYGKLFPTVVGRALLARWVTRQVVFYGRLRAGHAPPLLCFNSRNAGKIHPMLSPRLVFSIRFNSRNAGKIYGKLFPSVVGACPARAFALRTALQGKRSDIPATRVRYISDCLWRGTPITCFNSRNAGKIHRAVMKKIAKGLMFQFPQRW